MKSKSLLNCLLESSSLREDLLEVIGGVIKDILDNVSMSDELVARVSEKTYKFIKDYKEKDDE